MKKQLLLLLVVGTPLSLVAPPAASADVNTAQVHYWSMSNGQRTGGFNIYTPVSFAWHLKGVGDVNGDGTDDIIWQHGNGQVHYWSMSNGQRTGGFNIHTPVSFAWHLKGVGDVNGDGTDDIIWQHNNGQVHYWPMSNGQRTGGVHIDTPVIGWILKGVGDVNGDGTDDIIWQQSPGGMLQYWRMSNGQRTGGFNIYKAVGGEWSLVGAGDVNGDGTDDIIWQHNNGQVHYWPMSNGQRTGGVHIYKPVRQAWSLVGAGDVNGDGTDDIIWGYYPISFQQPFRCGQTWRAATYNGHYPDQDSLDLLRFNGNTNVSAGEDVLASASGVVIEAHHTNSEDPPYGSVVTIQHKGIWKTQYVHLDDALSVKTGDMVFRGQKIGVVGGEIEIFGQANAHLHYTQWKGASGVRATFGGWWATAVHAGAEDSGGNYPTQNLSSCF